MSPAIASTVARLLTNTRTSPWSTYSRRRACSHCIFCCPFAMSSTLCRTSALASPAAPTVTCSASRSASRVRCRTLGGSVALKTSVWRSGRVLRMIEKTCARCGCVVLVEPRPRMLRSHR